MYNVQDLLLPAPDDAGHSEGFEDTASETSTIAFEQEPFELMKSKVEELITHKLARVPSEIQIERMEGGAYNRVIGASVVPRHSTRFCTHWFYERLCRLFGMADNRDSSKYIVRIPRGETEGIITSQVAVLHAIAPRLSFPVPQVVAYNDSYDNHLGRPYMIQERLPGQALSNIWDALNLQQKKSVVKRYAELVSEIVSVEAVPGEISDRNLTAETGDPLHIDKMDRRGGAAYEPAKPQTSAEFMITLLRFWRGLDDEQHSWLHEIWDGLIAITHSLDQRGFLALPTALFHPDLCEYNLLAQIRGAEEVEITGVIDWDDAVIAPTFMAYRAPTWLWMPGDTDYEDDSLVNDEPVTEEDRKLKAYFLEHASEDYRRHAFSPESILARRMFYILEHGMSSDYAMDMAKDIIREWNKLHSEDVVRLNCGDSGMEGDDDSDGSDDSDVDDDLENRD
ncbi:APH-domain-containing protein [Pyrenochaeta sp. DS3sAY3a]|nr:APH-domain-containing protein [Pyrenochaeta sp. DS3sAY3a]